MRGPSESQPEPFEAPSPADQELVVRTGRDGSFSLWSEAFGEGFHSGRGALREARETFLYPSQLERFPAGSTIRVLEVCVGTGCNLAVLLEACASRGLHLDWTGLELDPEPLRLALSQPAFRAPWEPPSLAVLEQLRQHGFWQQAVQAAAPGPYKPGTDQACERDTDEEPHGSVDPASRRDRRGAREPGAAALADPALASAAREWPAAAAQPAAERRRADVLPPFVAAARCEVLCAVSSRGRLLWGDARQTLRQLQGEQPERFDLIWHDAFSPQRCPQLWSVEFLTDLTSLLRPQGRWISYCSAAAVREALRLAGLQLAALLVQASADLRQRGWSGGTVASPGPLPKSDRWRLLSAMEQEHLACSAGEPYSDPTGTASAPQILAARQQAQAEALAAGRRGSSSAWRRRWGVEG